MNHALKRSEARTLTGLILGLSNVSLAIDGKKIIRDLSWQVREGENWVLVGPNGAGKTTLLGILNGYHWPSGGRATVLGKDFGSFHLKELRKRIGCVSSYIRYWIPEGERVIDVVVSARYASIRSWEARAPGE